LALGFLKRIDMTELRSALIADLKQAWQTLQIKHPHGKFYGFGLYTTDDATYFYPTAFTEEGLTAVSTTYCEKYGGNINNQRASLRWSPCDSPLHTEGGDFSRSERAKDEFLALNENGDDSDSLEQGVFSAALEALLELDKLGLFGTGAIRGELLLSIWKGDQSDEERIAFAKILNPQSTTERFERELAEGYEAFVQLSK
jgi:hypothetical protein